MRRFSSSRDAGPLTHLGASRMTRLRLPEVGPSRNCHQQRGARARRARTPRTGRRWPMNLMSLLGGPTVRGLGGVISALHRREDDLALALLRLCDRHASDHEIHFVARDLGGWSREHLSLPASACRPTSPAPRRGGRLAGLGGARPKRSGRRGHRPDGARRGLPPTDAATAALDERTGQRARRASGPGGPDRC